jgi:hypothetical protein
MKMQKQKLLKVPITPVGPRCLRFELLGASNDGLSFVVVHFDRENCGFGSKLQSFKMCY